MILPEYRKLQGNFRALNKASRCEWPDGHSALLSLF